MSFDSFIAVTLFLFCKKGRRLNMAMRLAAFLAPIVLDRS
jgi:hypothetical protein